MKTTTFLFLGLFSIALLSCNNDAPVDNPLNPTETDDTKTADKETPSDKEDTEQITSNLVYGIDISKYQGDEMELLEKSSDSLNFVICRSTQGVTYTDPDFANNWKLCEEKGFIRGAYHFYMSDDSPEQQAANFLNAISDLKATDFPPIIDFENSSIAKGANKEKVIEDLWAFIFLIEKKTGRMPIIYTNGSIGNSYLTASRFANYTLWIADYTSAKEPTLPGAWKGMDWTMWQKSDDYHFENIQNDFDQFNGSLVDLKKMIAESDLKQ